jgi:CheY-like chemotaxis protein
MGVALTRERGRITIAVRDRGRGIPAELVDKVFDPFFTDKIHGSEIGLSLARHFVEAAGGTLTLAPRAGGRDRGPHRSSAGRRAVKVLIADDERNIRDSIAAYISAEGIATVTAADGAAARALLESEAFDGLVLDLRMPRVDGLALLSWLQEAGPPVPIIVISAYGDVRNAVEAMKRGAPATTS